MEGKSETGTFGPSGVETGVKNSCGGAEGALSQGRILKLAEKLREKMRWNDWNRWSVLGKKQIRGESREKEEWLEGIASLSLIIRAAMNPAPQGM